MVEHVMFFALGALCAGLISLTVLPSFWRRAERLVRRQLEQQLPLTPREIAAERDQLRAEFAVKQYRMETQIKEARTDKTRVQSQIGGYLISIATLGDEKTALNTGIAKLETLVQERDDTITDLNSVITKNETLIARHQQALTHRNSEYTVLEQDHQQLTQLAAGYAAEIMDHKTVICNLKTDVENQKTNSIKLQKELFETNKLHTELEDTYGRASVLLKERQIEISNLSTALELACIKADKQHIDLAHQNQALELKLNEAAALQRDLASAHDAQAKTYGQLEAALSLAARRREVIDAKNNMLQSKSSALNDIGQQTALLRAELSQEIQARKRFERECADLEKRIAPLQEGLQTTKRQSQETARDLTQTIDLLRANEQRALAKAKRVQTDVVS